MAGGIADQVPFGIDYGPVYAVAFSPDGAIVASAGAEGDVLLRDARTGADLGELVSDNEAVWSMAFSPDGAALAIGDEDGTVRLWDVRTGEQHGWPGRIGVSALAFSHEGSVLAGSRPGGIGGVQSRRNGVGHRPKRRHGLANGGTTQSRHARRVCPECAA